jgi:hypothetical protein
MSTPWQEFGGRVTAALNADPPRVAVVLGADGSGRTSLLRRLAACLSAGSCQFVDCEHITSTPERFLGSLVDHTPFAIPSYPRDVPGPQAAFADVLDLLTRARTREGGLATFLFDEWLEIRTFEHFPGLRQVVPDLLANTLSSPNRFVLTTRFVTRALRLFEATPDRFVVLSIPPMGVSDIAADLLRIPGCRSDTAEEFAHMILAFTGGRVGYVRALVDALSAPPSLGDPISALLVCLAPDGVLDRRCRYTYEYRLHRARGYGALKAILGILAVEEPLTLTEIAIRLGRTPGSTRDYLRWLEDVDLVVAHRKHYAFADPILRVWVRLFDRPSPPGEEVVAATVQRYALARVSQPPSL